jgi:hypothetical protein
MRFTASSLSVRSAIVLQCLGDSISSGIITPTPPGWYQDPSDGNPDARRWWDGNNWSGHVTSVAPTSAIASAGEYPAFAALPSPATRPSTGLNTLGWIALGLAILDAVIAVISVPLPAWAPFLIPVSIVTILLGIAALVLRGLHKSATLVSPIIVIALTVVLSTVAGLAWLAQTSIHNEQAAVAIEYPNSPELNTLYLKTRTIERGIRAQASAYNWPTSVAADAQGRVIVGGKLLATLASGESLSYTVSKNGEDFVLRVNGRVAGEYFYYDLDTHEIDTYCYAGDDACVQTAG